MERLLVFFFLMLPSLGVATSITAACVSIITSLSIWKSNGNVSGLAAVAAPSSWSVFLCRLDQYPVMMNLCFCGNLLQVSNLLVSTCSCSSLPAEGRVVPL